MNIVSAIKGGDHFVFQQVFDQYHQKLYFFILNKTKSEYVAEEVVQMAFIKLWESRHTLSEDFTISTQLYRVATTTLIDFLRKQSSNNAVIKELAAGDIEPGNDAVNEIINGKELHKRISGVINGFPPIRRQVFEMSREQGMSYKEIAETLSVSTKTVETHISKALKQIRKYLKVMVIIIIKIFF